MSNKRRGIEKERDAKKLLESKGLKVLRARGSLGDVDLVAFDAYELLFVSVKRVKGKYFSFKAEKEKLQSLPVPPKSHVEIWIWLDRLAGRKAGWTVELIK